MQEEKILIEQQLSNSLASKDYHKALLLAFSLGHKGKALDIIDSILVIRGGEENSFAKGQERLLAVVKLLTEEQIAKCLVYIRDWNAIGELSTCCLECCSHFGRQIQPYCTTIASCNLAGLPTQLFNWYPNFFAIMIHLMKLINGPQGS